MGIQRHRIGRTVLNLKLKSRSTAIKEQQQVSTLFHEQIMPEFEELFDNICPTNEILQFDKLEIIIGDFNLNDTDTFISILKEKTRKAIEAAIQSGHYLRISGSEHAFYNLLFFLKYGYFKWQSESTDIRELSKRLMPISWSDSWVENLLVVLNDPMSLRRLFRQSSNDLIKKIELVLYDYFKISQEEKNLLVQARRSSDSREESEFTIEALLKIHSNSLAVDKIIISNTETERHEREEISNADLIETHFAGIVLLNPIIQPMFDSAGLLSGNQFVSVEHAEKAVYILHYLINKESELYENQAVLLKILCGLELDHSLPRTFELSDDVKSNCENAIRSIIKEWQVLKNTGNQAFIENFILRNGIISVEDNAYNLNVESNAVDVILAYNPPPWTVGMIRLPWMTKILYVNWF